MNDDAWEYVDAECHSSGGEVVDILRRFKLLSRNTEVKRSVSGKVDSFGHPYEYTIEIKVRKL